MSSHLPLILTIDHIIQQIDKVKVFQEHWQLIATYLAILQNELSQRNTLDDTNQRPSDMEQTLIVINDLVDGCSEKDVNLNGVTYRDLESLLLRLHLRLAQHKANFTNDYQIKIQILTEAHHEQQTFIQKCFHEKLKQRIESIEQETKDNTIEHLRFLREKYFNIIKLYLHGCTELHKSVPLTGLTTHIVTKVAQNFYQLSSNEQTQLQSKWQSCDLPLTRTFIQFKPDKSTSFERNEARRLLIEPETNILQGSRSKKATPKKIWERLVSAPYMMSMIERDRYAQEQDEDDVSEETIIRTKRWIVILGDPGSGKTSFSRWLVHHLAQTLLLNDQHSTDYGPLRIPILIRIGEFAEILKQQPTLSLFDYIGKHKWMGKDIIDDPSISLDHLSCALQDYIKYGHALIILDGLDEIPVSDQRSLIINTVENFVDTYIQTPTGGSAFDNAYLSRLLDDPSRSGGNQLIITSRIVGYHAAPLAGQFAHYTIRPMDMEHMKDFVDYWFFRVHQQIIDTLDLSIPNQGEKHGEALKEELEKEESNNGLLDVASNSCLLSFICSVAFSQFEGSPLPTQRIRLYEAIVNSMLTLWSSKRSTIPIPDLIRILSDIATYIHGNSASGLIHEEKMKEICIQSIKEYSSKTLQSKGKDEVIENEANEFVRIIREDVGILAARGESLYGFLHLTFQEYFTCLKLINVDEVQQKSSDVLRSFEERQVQIVVQSLRQHANNPRFRVPVALALGKISLSWSKKDFNYFCLQFIQEQDKDNSVLPIGAYMIISFSNDFVNYPSNDVLFDTLDRLIIAAGQHKWSIVCPFLFDHITNALRKLRQDVVSLWINNLLSQSSLHNIQTISALCHLLQGKPHEYENIKWLNQSSCLMLQHLSTQDNEINEFAIDRLLVKIAFSNHRLLPVNPTTFKEFLITEEIELHSIPVTLYPLIITLYGGLKRDGGSVVFDPFHIYRESIALTPILARFLSKNYQHRQDEVILLIKQECLKSLVNRIENCDESPETADLCIATICLFGIDYVRKNTKFISNSLIRISMNRFKYISMILRQFYFAAGENNTYYPKQVTKFISCMIDSFQYSESSKIQFLDLLDSLRTSMIRLRSSETSVLVEKRSEVHNQMITFLPNSFRKEQRFLNYLLSTDIQFGINRKSCSLLYDFTKLFWVLEHNHKFDTFNRMSVARDEIPEYLLFRNDADLLFPLAFIPEHLRKLYVQLLKQNFIRTHPKDSSINENANLFFGHILTESFISLSTASYKRFSRMTALITLLPMLRKYRLENFASSLLWTLAPKYSNYLKNFEDARQQPIDDETGLYINRVDRFDNFDMITDEERRTLIDKCINEERQRLQDALAENDEKSMNLYSASISLAHAYHWVENDTRLCLLEESIQGAMAIHNKLARLDALCVIGFYSYSDYNHIQINKNRFLQEEIEYQLRNIYPDLPLLLHSAIFIRCLPLLQDQQLIDECLQNLMNKFNNVDQIDQHIAYEALSYYLQSNSTFQLSDYNQIMNNKSSVLKEHITHNINENLSISLLIPNLYLVELTSDLQKNIIENNLHMVASHSNLVTIDNSFISTLFHYDGPLLTIAQAMMITNILCSISSSKQLCVTTLSNALHRFDLVELKACRLLESWMKWKDSNELCFFAYHAALLLVNSDFWSVEAAAIICDLLCYENDRFRQRAEIVLRSEDNCNVRTSSKIGLDVLLTLCMKKIWYEQNSSFAVLTLTRMSGSITIDNRSHLDTFLWLERYQIHALLNKEYSLEKSKLSIITSFFSSHVAIDVSICQMLKKLTDDLFEYICELIKSNFLPFLNIDGDTTSNEVLESHNQFIISIITCFTTLYRFTFQSQGVARNVLLNLFKTSDNDKIRRASTSALSYICNEYNYKILFKELQIAVETESNKSLYTDYLMSALISSYCHCVAINNVNFNDVDIDLFRKLLKYSSKNILQATRAGLARVIKDKSILLEMFDSDCVQCYHALIDATSYSFIFDIWQDSIDVVAEFIEQHPDLLSIFIVELYNSIRHYTNTVIHVKTADYYLQYGYCRYVEVASLLAVRMPATFCGYIKDWYDGDNLKRALFYTSKQHNYLQRAACLTIMSIFGELTIELCEMIIKALRDDPHVQNICYKCLNRINSIKDEKAVLDLLFFYLKSKSMNTRYAAAKMLLHLSKSSLIPSNQVQIVLNNLILDPDSNESLWLVQEHDDFQIDCIYNYTGRLKDVIYSHLVQNLIGDISVTVRRYELNDIDTNFFESETASRLASCLYEEKPDEDFELAMPPTKSID